MVLLCFVLDLRFLSPPFLGELKQALLQLGNFYAISSWRSERQSDLLVDRIGLCYLLCNRISSSPELKIAYSPREQFNLRDFHHAVNSLPNDAFFPNDCSSISSQDLASVLGDEVLYSWGGKDILKKVILITSCLAGKMDSVMRKTLMDAAEKYVSLEFVLLEDKSSHVNHMSEEVINFIKHICELENCCFHTYLPDLQILNGVVKRWLWELKDDMEESFQCCFIFKSNLVGSVNSISCNLGLSAREIIDGFSPCQACRCHGIPLDDIIGDRTKRPSTCPVTDQDLGALDVIKNALKIGKHTVLHLPSFQSCLKFQQVSFPIELNVIERTKLESLSEGVIVGTSYFVTPSTFHEIEASSDDIDKSELNAQLFKGLCCELNSLDQGLVCSSHCNIETMRETTFLYYYILLPSDGGPMFLRRLAGSEEVFPISNFNHCIESPVTKEIQDTIQTSLLKMALRDYNPLLHERGFHQKLNLLVLESLQCRLIFPIHEVETSELNPTQLNSITEGIVLSKSAADVTVRDDEMPQLDLAAREVNSLGCIAEEWEELIVNEFPKIYSPNSISEPKFGQSVVSPPDCCRQLDVNTSRILERLEVPRQLKTNAISPIITGKLTTDAGASAKVPQIPLKPIHAADSCLIASQPMKPNFQRLKRKYR